MTPFQEVYAAGIKMLSRREHSRQELARKLQKRWGDPALVEQVLELLQQERLQSDERYTESYIRLRSEKGYGPLRIVAELRERGIGEALAQGLLQASGVDWYARASECYRKKYHDLPVDDFKEKAKRMRFLQYRGFGPQHIAEAMALGNE